MLMNMRDLLAVAHENDFAVPAFNISSNMLLKGAIEAAEEKRAPVIIAIHPDELSFIRPSFVKAVLEEAVNATVPVCIHLDHGSSMGQIMEAIRCGFTSVMIDASAYPLAQNIEISKRVVDLAHSVDVSVEGELGTIGTTGPEAEAGSEEIIFTNPNEVVAFVEATCVDTLAVAIGTSHGLYPKDKKPQLRLDLLKEITSRVDIPLVLHGGLRTLKRRLPQRLSWASIRSIFRATSRMLSTRNAVKSYWIPSFESRLLFILPALRQ